MNDLSIQTEPIAQLAAAVKDQQVTGARLEQCVSEFARLLVAMKAQMDQLQKDLQSKVTISSSQARAIQEAVKDRATELCESKGLSYAACGKAVREAIWRELYREFSIGSRYDLQANRFQSSIDFVAGWNSFSIIRKIREKYGGG